MFFVNVFVYATKVIPYQKALVGMGRDSTNIAEQKALANNIAQGHIYNLILTSVYVVLQIITLQIEPKRLSTGTTKVKPASKKR
jgi:hypothetical protein